MNLNRLLGWGIIIYAIVSLAATGITAYGAVDNVWAHLLELLALMVVCIIAGNSLKFRTWKDILPYSIGWAIIAAVLDAVFAVPLSGWQLYGDWSPWAGYALVALLPLLAPIFRKSRVLHGVWES